jgi:hypothetical protein
MANQVVSNENNLGYNDSLTKNENKKGDWLCQIPWLK